MLMKLAFSTTACPEWTIAQVAERAEAMGYEGVELRTLGPGSTGLASDPALSDPEKVRDVFRASAIEPVCLSTSTSLHHRNASAAKAARWQIMKDLELAAQIGCQVIRVFAYEVEPGENRRSVIQRVAEQVRPLAEKAGELDVEILFENAGSFCGAKDWWSLLNLLEHPMLGLVWNVANAAAAGESSAISVTMLNSRIHLVKVKDTKVGEGSGFVSLGEGTVEIERFLKRLMGVGYSGYVVVEWDRLWLPALSPASTYLPDAYERLTGWFNAIMDAEKKGVEVAEKAAKRNTPKPRPRYEPAQASRLAEKG